MVGDSNVLTLLLMNFEHNTFYNNHVLLKELSFYFSLEAKKKNKNDLQSKYEVSYICNIIFILSLFLFNFRK